MPKDIQALEPSIVRTAQELLEAVDRAEKDLSIGASWEDRILDWSLAEPERKTRILRFIDVFSSLKRDADVVDHLKVYFPSTDDRLPLTLRAGLRVGGGLLSGRVLAAATRLTMQKMARRFIGGETSKEAAATLRKLKDQGFEASLDFLGEATLTEVEADQNLRTIVSMMEDLGASGLNVSVKCSSLTSFLDPVDPDEVAGRLVPRLRILLRAAVRHGVFVHFDAEQYEVCDLVLEMIVKLLLEEEFAGKIDAGVVLQVYLRDAEERLEKLMHLAEKMSRPITTRIVKGAYWDSEVIRARRMGWTPPVYLRKSESDACFERMALKLLSAHRTMRTAVASHNLRSIAAALTFAKELGVPPDRLEFQFLYGMARATRKVLADRGHAVRVYTPYGQLIPGMAYLVRRLLENSSNESFLRHRRLGRLAASDLLKNPHGVAASASASKGPDKFENAPPAEFHKTAFRQAMASAVRRSMEFPRRKIGPVIGGDVRPGKKQILSLNPSHPARVVAEVDLAGVSHVKEAAAAARHAWKSWGRCAAADRGKILRKAADLLEARRMDMAALEVIEAGKPWPEAQADVSEAVDYLRYYSQEALRLEQGLRLQPEIPGEINVLSYRPRGVAAVISPWNFPLAIPAGQVSAALAAGNAVLFKPSEQTSLIGYRLFEMLREAGVPSGVLHFLPGIGEEVGPALVEHPDVDVIAFTGSRAVGENILRRASAAGPAPSGPKRVIAEMGGKNAVIVDSDADLDLAISECLTAAFDYAGQKCSALSRLILLDDIYDAFLNRFVEAARFYPMGFAETPGTRLSPLIDSAAVKRVRGYFELASREGRWVLPPDEARIALFREACSVPPGIVSLSSPDARVAQEEIFGPLVSVLSARGLEEAIAIANGTAYALTGGFFSRHPEHIERVRRELDVGNLYINRAITGAVVGRQPFGGHRMSGVGSKAGGPEYLAQFCLPITSSENLSRHGFSPDISK